MAKAAKKSSLGGEQFFIRLARRKVENSHYPAYQLEKITVSGDEVIKREWLYQPDMLQSVLAHADEALDPESIVAMDPSLTEAI